MRRALLERIDHRLAHPSLRVRRVDWTTGETSYALIPVVVTTDWSRKPNTYSSIATALRAAVDHAEMRPEVAHCFAQSLLGGAS